MNSTTITPSTLSLFALLRLLDESVKPSNCKIHLANCNGQEDPLDVYLAGGFDEWQSWQSKPNFERDVVVSLIALPQANHWLFVGLYDSIGSQWVDSRQLHLYELRKREAARDLEGRLVVHFKRPGRQSYLLGENWSDAIRVAELRPEPLCMAEFPGYSWVMLSKQHLDIVVREQIPSWRAALASVAGVYVIADRNTGKLYVGSATAGEGIWSRWCEYSATGHGGNRELRELLAIQGESYADNFQYGILEIADSHASQDDILRRESRWKELLLTRDHGYNSN